MTSKALTTSAKPVPTNGKGDSRELSAEVSELRYRRLFETAQDGILILDARSGEIIDVNPFLLDLLDYPFESIIGLQLCDIGLFEDIAANQAAFAGRLSCEAGGSDLTTQDAFQLENSPPPDAKTSVAITINSANGKS